jgi:hypothetical protein
MPAPGLFPQWLVYVSFCEHSGEGWGERTAEMLDAISKPEDPNMRPDRLGDLGGGSAVSYADQDPPYVWLQESASSLLREPDQEQVQVFFAQRLSPGKEVCSRSALVVRKIIDEPLIVLGEFGC